MYHCYVSFIRGYLCLLGYSLVLSTSFHPLPFKTPHDLRPMAVAAVISSPRRKAESRFVSEDPTAREIHGEGPGGEREQFEVHD